MSLSVEFTAGGLTGLVLGFATIVIVWRLYLGARAADAQRGTGTQVPRRDRVFARVLMAAGTILIAAGAVLVLAHPWDTADSAAVATVLGGPAAYLLGDLVLTRAATGRIAASRIAALACLAVLALIAFALPVLVLSALVLAVLLLLALAASGWFRLPSMNVDE